MRPPVEHVCTARRCRARAGEQEARGMMSRRGTPSTPAAGTEAAAAAAAAVLLAPPESVAAHTVASAGKRKCAVAEREAEERRLREEAAEDLAFGLQLWGFEPAEDHGQADVGRTGDTPRVGDVHALHQQTGRRSMDGVFNVISDASNQEFARTLRMQGQGHGRVSGRARHVRPVSAPRSRGALDDHAISPAQEHHQQVHAHGERHQRRRQSASSTDGRLAHRDEEPPLPPVNGSRGRRSDEQGRVYERDHEDNEDRPAAGAVEEDHVGTALAASGAMSASATAALGDPLSRDAFRSRIPLLERTFYEMADESPIQQLTLSQLLVFGYCLGLPWSAESCITRLQEIVAAGSALQDVPELADAAEHDRRQSANRRTGVREERNGKDMQFGQDGVITSATDPPVCDISAFLHLVADAMAAAPHAQFHIRLQCFLELLHANPLRQSLLYATAAVLVHEPAEAPTRHDHGLDAEDQGLLERARRLAHSSSTAGDNDRALARAGAGGAGQADASTVIVETKHVHIFLACLRSQAMKSRDRHVPDSIGNPDVVFISQAPHVEAAQWRVCAEMAYCTRMLREHRLKRAIEDFLSQVEGVAVRLALTHAEVVKAEHDAKLTDPRHERLQTGLGSERHKDLVRNGAEHSYQVQAGRDREASALAEQMNMSMEEHADNALLAVSSASGVWANKGRPASANSALRALPPMPGARPANGGDSDHSSTSPAAAAPGMPEACTALLHAVFDLLEAFYPGGLVPWQELIRFGYSLGRTWTPAHLFQMTRDRLSFANMEVGRPNDPPPTLDRQEFVDTLRLMAGSQYAGDPINFQISVKEYIAFRSLSHHRATLVQHTLMVLLARPAHPSRLSRLAEQQLANGNGAAWDERSSKTPLISWVEVAALLACFRKCGQSPSPTASSAPSSHDGEREEEAGAESGLEQVNGSRRTSLGSLLQMSPHRQLGGNNTNRSGGPARTPPQAHTHMKSSSSSPPFSADLAGDGGRDSRSRSLLPTDREIHRLSRTAKGFTARFCVLQHAEVRKAVFAGFFGLHCRDLADEALHASVRMFCQYIYARMSRETSTALLVVDGDGQRIDMVGPNAVANASAVASVAKTHEDESIAFRASAIAMLQMAAEGMMEPDYYEESQRRTATNRHIARSTAENGHNREVQRMMQIAHAATEDAAALELNADPQGSPQESNADPTHAEPSTQSPPPQPEMQPKQPEPQSQDLLRTHHSQHQQQQQQPQQPSLMTATDEQRDALGLPVPVSDLVEAVRIHPYRQSRDDSLFHPSAAYNDRRSLLTTADEAERFREIQRQALEDASRRTPPRPGAAQAADGGFQKDRWNALVTENASPGGQAPLPQQAAAQDADALALAAAPPVVSPARPDGHNSCKGNGSRSTKQENGNAECEQERSWFDPAETDLDRPTHDADSVPLADSGESPPGSSSRNRRDRDEYVGSKSSPSPRARNRTPVPTPPRSTHKGATAGKRASPTVSPAHNGGAGQVATHKLANPSRLQLFAIGIIQAAVHRWLGRRRRFFRKYFNAAWIIMCWWRTRSEQRRQMWRHYRSAGPGARRAVRAALLPLPDATGSAPAESAFDDPHAAELRSSRVQDSRLDDPVENAYVDALRNDVHAMQTISSNLRESSIQVAEAVLTTEELSHGSGGGDDASRVSTATSSLSTKGSMRSAASEHAASPSIVKLLSVCNDLDRELGSMAQTVQQLQQRRAQLKAYHQPQQARCVLGQAAAASPDRSAAGTRSTATPLLGQRAHDRASRASGERARSARRSGKQQSAASASSSSSSSSPSPSATVSASNTSRPSSHWSVSRRPDGVIELG